MPAKRPALRRVPGWPQTSLARTPRCLRPPTFARLARGRARNDASAKRFDLMTIFNLPKLESPMTLDPTTAYATPPQPKQQQEMPGETERMAPAPDHGETDLHRSWPVDEQGRDHHRRRLRDRAGGRHCLRPRGGRRPGLIPERGGRCSRDCSLGRGRGTNRGACSGRHRRGGALQGSRRARDDRLRPARHPGQQCRPPGEHR